MLYCSRYKKECEEAIIVKCDVPSNYSDVSQQLEECRNCAFCESKEN